MSQNIRHTKEDPEKEAAPVGDALEEDIEASETLDKICWADIVLLVQGTLDKEDIHYCKGKTCNYCGKFGVRV